MSFISLAKVEKIQAMDKIHACLIVLRNRIDARRNQLAELREEVCDYAWMMFEITFGGFPGDIVESVLCCSGGLGGVLFAVV